MRAIHYLDGLWKQGNPKIMGPMTHAAWMASVVFDGARAFEGVTPDLDRHCERLVASAWAFGLKPSLTAGEVQAIAEEGVSRFAKGSELYIRPMFYADDGFVAPDPDSTRFCCSLFEAPLPKPNGISICLSSFRRPPPDMAPTDAKASCLYPNAARAIREAAARGFDNAAMLDANGNVAELATANIWIARDGVAITPVANGTFLAGITRSRVAALLREAGVKVEERSVTWKDVTEADEVFTTGNYAKVLPIVRVEERHLQPGPLYKRARELYWHWALNGSA